MTLSAATVLVVDDEPVLNLTMSLLLERAGARVLRAGNGVEALEVVEQNHVDVMVCDQNMPEMDGKTLLRTLHASDSSVPSLLFVSGVEIENVEALTAMGVRRFISKPIQPVALIEAVTSVLESHSSAD